MYFRGERRTEIEPRPRAHPHERARTPRMPKKTKNIPKQSMGNALGKRPTGVVANRASK